MVFIRMVGLTLFEQKVKDISLEAMHIRVERTGYQDISSVVKYLYCKVE